MTISTALKRVSTAVASLALAVGGAVALGGAANAAPAPGQPGAPDSGTLKIYKYSGSPVQDPLQLDPDNLLDGVEFTVTRVGKLAGTDCVPLDLTDAADWDGLDGPTGLFESAPAAPTDPFCLTTTSSAQETTNGETTFNLDVGVYYVQETDPGDNPIVSAVPNFYVSIPTSEGAEGEGWNYNVVAHPKNQLMETPTKTISGEQTELVLGSEVTWTMNIPVPTLNNEETFTEAIITDNLDSRLDYVPNSSTVTVGGETLSEGTDFNVTGNAVWTFTAAGLAKLDQNMGETISIKFKTKVTSVGNGEIPNDDYSSKFNGTEVPGETVPYTYWGELAIKKSDNSTPARALEGAEFQVFPAPAGGTCAADAPSSGSVATGTSDASGVVKWDPDGTESQGLWIANVNDGPAVPVPTKDYCVYETVVPAGYTAGNIDNRVTISPGEEAKVTLTVVNAKKDGPDLPLTGAQGTLAMTIGGLLLVAAGVGGVAIARKRNANAN